MGFQKITIAALILAALTAALALPTVKIPYQVNETYTETTPVIETHTEQVPVRETCIPVKMDGSLTIDASDDDPKEFRDLLDGNAPRDDSLAFSIHNNGDADGNFTLNVNLWDDGRRFIEAVDYKTVTIQAGKSYEGELDYLDLWGMTAERPDQFNLDLKIPTKEECHTRYRNETVESVVNKTLTKTRTITRYHRKNWIVAALDG